MNFFAFCLLDSVHIFSTLTLRIVGVPVVDRQNLRLVKELPVKLGTRQGRECPVAAHLKLG